MYQKGKDFILAAMLLNQKNRFNYVYRHLICQELENILKSLLLFKDFKRFKPLLKPRRELGHDLEKIVLCWSKELNGNRINVKLLNEIKTPNIFYKNHRLRYGSIADLLFDLRKSKVKSTMKFIHKIIIKVNKKLRLLRPA